MILRLLRKIVNRKTLLLVFLIVFLAGLILTFVGTVRVDENLPIRIEFATYPEYTAELNSFFNRTEVTPLEDAQNKLIEDYILSGYIILPKAAMPAEGYPVIIWMHGFAASAELQINYPRLFAKCGFLAVAISQPGHGCSGGYWDMGIQALLGVYSTVEWLVNDSAYKDIIDINRIGVAGHSMGGIVTTRSGLFDNWTNPKTGRKVGTGGAIRSYCAVYCWDDLYSMASNLVNEFLGVEDIWNHPTITSLLSQWRWLSNHDPSIIEEEVRIRSVSNFITAENIPNYCLITGSEDELTTVEAQCYIMANATINASGTPEVPWTRIYSEVTAAANHTWNFGDMATGTARRFVLTPGITHIGEAFDRSIMSNAVLWFNQSMNCTDIIEVPPNFNRPFISKMLGWFLMLIGMVGCILPAFSYLSTSKLRVISPEPNIAPNLKLKKWKIFIPCISIPLVAFTLAAFIPLQSMTHFWIFDLIIPTFLMCAIFLLPMVVLVALLEYRRYAYQNEDLGFSKSFKDNLRAILIPVLAILACVAIFDVAAWVLQVPILLPRPLDAAVYLDFFTLFSILLLLNFNFELLFRGLYQTKIEQYDVRKLTRWKIVLKSGLFSGICIGGGLGIHVLITFGGLFGNAPILVVGLIGGIIAAFILLGIVSAYIYQKTRNILSATFFNTLLMALFIAGKLFLTYA